MTTTTDEQVQHEPTFIVRPSFLDRAGNWARGSFAPLFEGYETDQTKRDVIRVSVTAIASTVNPIAAIAMLVYFGLKSADERSQTRAAHYLEVEHPELIARLKAELAKQQAEQDAKDKAAGTSPRHAR